MSLVQNARGRTSAWFRDNRFEAWFLAGVFVAFTALASQFPRSGDDWAWGSQIGIDRLDSHFGDYNGRYGGDLLVLAVTRLPIFTPVIVAAIVTLTVFLIQDLTGNRTRWGYLLTSVLFLTMPVETWRQAVVWLSGFTNYAVAGLCLLVFLRSTKREWSGESPRRAGAAWLVAIFVFGFVSALFMEHVTLYLVAASILSVIAFGRRRGSLPVRGVVWAASFVIGAGVMFSNGAYRSATGAGSEKRYQNIQTGGGRSAISRIIEKMTDTISAQGVTHNVTLNFVVLLLVVLLIGAPAATVSLRLRRTVFSLTGAFFALTYALPVATANLHLQLRARALNGVAAVILLAILVCVTLLIVRDLDRRFQILVCCGSIIVVMGPLLVVNPVGPRCFYPTYLVFLLIVNLLAREFSERQESLSLERLVPFLGALTVGLFATSIMIYGIIQHDANRRIADIREQVDQGAKAVTVEQLPFIGYVHYPDPSNALLVERFKLYYNLPADLKIALTPRR